MWVAPDLDDLLDVQQSPILLLFLHFDTIPVYHVVQDGCMFSESRLLDSVCQFLPLIPCLGPPLHDVGCLNSVVFELNIQGSNSLTYVVLRAIPITTYLVDGICRLASILLISQPEQMLTDGFGRFESTGDATCFLIYIIWIKKNDP